MAIRSVSPALEYSANVDRHDYQASKIFLVTGPSLGKTSSDEFSGVLTSFGNIPQGMRQSICNRQKWSSKSMSEETDATYLASDSLHSYRVGP